MPVALPFLAGMALFVAAWLAPLGLGWLLVGWGVALGVVLSPWRRLGWRYLGWYCFCLTVVTCPLLLDFVCWFSWQWYLAAAWGVLLLLVWCGYGVWWGGLWILRSLLLENTTGRIIYSCKGGECRGRALAWNFVAAGWSLAWFWAVSKLWIFCCGGDEGIFLFHPLVPLLSCQWARSAVACLSWPGLTGLLFWYFFATGSLLARQRWRQAVGLSGLVVALSFVLELVVNSCGPPAVGPPVGPLLCGCRPFTVAVPFSYDSHPDNLGRAQRVACAVASCDAAVGSLLVLPESFLAADLALHTSVRAVIAGLSVGRAVVCGAQRGCSSGRLANAMYYFGDGELVASREKQHLMPFFERVPACWGTGGLVCYWRLFGTLPFVAAGQVAPTCWRCGCGWMAVLLCSELFFTSALRHLPAYAEALALVHDGWFCCSAAAELLWCLAAAKAIGARRSIGYCSYRYAGHFDRFGRWSAWSSLVGEF